jgi:hypothetical protein
VVAPCRGAGGGAEQFGLVAGVVPAQPPQVALSGLAEIGDGADRGVVRSVVVALVPTAADAQVKRGGRWGRVGAGLVGEGVGQQTVHRDGVGPGRAEGGEEVLSGALGRGRVRDLLERSTISRWLGVLLSFAGILVVVLAQSRDTATGFSGWAVLALLAPASYAVTNTYAARTKNAQSSVARAAGSNVVAAGGMILVLGLYTLANPAVLHIAAVPAPVVAAGLVAIVANVGASLAFFRLASLGGATKAGLASYITVLVGVVAGWLALAEPVTVVAAVAALGVVAGVALAARSPREADRHEQPTPTAVSET